MTTPSRPDRAERRAGSLGPATLVAMTLAVLAVLVAGLVLWPAGDPPPTPDRASDYLREPTGPAVESIPSTPASQPQSAPVEAAVDEPPPFPHPIDPATFLPPFADSALVGDLATLCNVPAPPGSLVVAPDGDDGGDGTVERPLASIAEAVARVEPGQQILVRQGRYQESVVLSGRSGQPGAWITLRSYPGERATLVGQVGRDSVALRRGSSFVNIVCLDLAGPALDPSAAPASPSEHRERRLAGAGPVEIPRNYGSGIDIGDQADTEQGLVSHHVRVIGNRVTNYAEMGISAMEANHITIAGNTTAGNAKHSCHSGSGIGLAHMLDQGGGDNPDGYSNYIIGNVSYENENLSLQCFSESLGAILTDGNGIIIDLTNSTDYQGRTLVADNLTFGNGGRGILVFRSSRVDVINNTSFHNIGTSGLMGNDGPHAEIALADSDGSRVYNNIAIPQPGHVAFAGAGSDLDVRTNLFRDPGDGLDLFTAPGRDPATVDFTPIGQDWIGPGTPLLVTIDEKGSPAVLSPIHLGAINTFTATAPDS